MYEYQNSSEYSLHFELAEKKKSLGTNTTVKIPKRDFLLCSRMCVIKTSLCIVFKNIYFSYSFMNSVIGMNTNLVTVVCKYISIVVRFEKSDTKLYVCTVAEGMLTRH